MAKSAAALREEALRLSHEATEQQEKAKRLLAEARKAEREERQAKERAENHAHYLKMQAEGAELSGLNEAQHAIVYSKAWSRGHDEGGYHAIEGHYGELAQMAREILDAN